MKLILMGPDKVRNETKTKWNRTDQNVTEPIETKRNQWKRNETNWNKSKWNKKKEVMYQNEKCANIATENKRPLHIAYKVKVSSISKYKCFKTFLRLKRSFTGKNQKGTQQISQIKRENQEVVCLTQNSTRTTNPLSLFALILRNTYSKLIC
jgi:hypothetical protein